MKPAATLVVFAVVLLVGGLVAYLSAPEGANASTALIVPAACAAVVLVVAQMVAGRIGGERGRRVGRVAAPVLLVALTLLFAWRAKSAGDAVETWKRAQGSPTPQAGAPDHDKTYLRNLLWGLTAAGAVAAVTVVLALRRRPSPGA